MSTFSLSTIVITMRVAERMLSSLSIPSSRIWPERILYFFLIVFTCSVFVLLLSV